VVWRQCRVPQLDSSIALILSNNSPLFTAFFMRSPCRLNSLR
jgi:hypothetical protein